jgi:sarcosine oxidase subunit gamma
MTDSSQELAGASAWPVSSIATAALAGVRVTRRETLGIATVIARKDAGEMLARRVNGLFGVQLPQGPQHAFARGSSFIGVGRGVWLATSEAQGSDFTTLLRESIGDLASISDQTDAYALVRVSGPKVRAVLGKLIPVDVHPRTFGIGAAAVTIAAHIGVTFWRLEDEGEDVPVFDLAVPRSMAGSFWQMLMESDVKPP